MAITKNRTSPFVAWLRSQKEFDPILVATDPKVATQAKAAFEAQLPKDESNGSGESERTVSYFVAIRKDKKGKPSILRADAGTFGKGRSGKRVEIEDMHDLLSAAPDVTCVQLRTAPGGVEIVGATVESVLEMFGLTAAQVQKIQIEDHSKAT